MMSQNTNGIAVPSLLGQVGRKKKEIFPVGTGMQAARNIQQ